MQDFDTVIRKMIEQGIVTLEDGLSYATNQNNLLLQLKGLSSTEDYLNNNKNKRPVVEPISPSPAATASSSGTSVLDMLDKLLVRTFCRRPEAIKIL